MEFNWIVDGEENFREVAIAVALVVVNKDPGETTDPSQRIDHEFEYSNSSPTVI